MLHSPAETGHRLHSIEERGVLTRVAVALVVPGRYAVDGGIRLQERHGLTEVEEEVERNVQVLLDDDHVLGPLWRGRG